MTGGLDDTIAAIATAPGRAGIAVVRVSGSRAGEVGEALTRTATEGWHPRRAELRVLYHPESGERIDRAVVTWFPAPGSYTGEDQLEVSSHGGALVPARVLDAACAAGARPARPGEFTRRAYLNGKLDLVQAEATLDLIDARTPRMGEAALFALERGLSRRVESLRRRVVELAALLAYDIDFPDEDDGPVDPSRIDAESRALAEEIAGVVRHAPEGELLREGALVVVAGRPNAGKSSLFNALLGRERAIVTDRPGTTRDAIEALVSIDGYPFRLVDTAGLREGAEMVEALGIEVARTYLERADLVLSCVEADRSPRDEERAFVTELDRRIGARRALVVRTKADQAPDGISGFVRSCEGHSSDEGHSGELAVCAPDGTGLPALREAMLAAVFQGLRSEDEPPLVTHERHARGLRAAAQAIEHFRAARADGLPAEIAATHLEDAAHALEAIVGAITSEDVLAAVFEGFCVGK